MKIVIILFLCFVLASCESGKSKTVYFSNGNVFYTDTFNDEGTLLRRETFSERGTPMAIIYYKEGRFDKSEIYHGDIVVGEYKYKNDTLARAWFKHGNVKRYGEGRIDEFSREQGWWHYYDHNRKIIEKRYSILFGKEQIVNQSYIYENGKVDSMNSQFADLRIHENKAQLIYKRRENKYSYVSLLVSPKIKNDFSNIDQVEFDTITFGSKEKMNFTITNEVRRKTLRGYIVEQYTEEDFKPNEEIDMIERRTLFEKVLP